MRFTSLMGMVSAEERLRASFESQNPRKAPGVDGMRKEVYQEGIVGRIADLSARLRRLGYHPKPSRRVYIPKADGSRRPLGIPSFEDRIVQDRLSQILQAIWEPEFRECSYGFRPGRSAHDALRRVADVATRERTQWVVEADIRGFFNEVSHDHLMRFLEHRIGDPRFLRVIRRFLKAGVMEDGVCGATEAGTPQGGLVSPVLANIYLHYVLDWWFEGRYAKSCRGKAFLVRYADDFVACFQEEEDARRFLSEVKERLAAFDLEVEPTKTAIHRFGSAAKSGSLQDGRKRPATFNFLGFTHYVGVSRTGRFMVGRKTEGRRLRRKLQEVNQRLKALRKHGGRVMTTYLRQHLSGYIQYYGVRGNGRSLGAYVFRAGWLLYKWLNRRSQRRSITAERFGNLLKQGLLPRPQLIHDLYPKNVWMF